MLKRAYVRGDGSCTEGRRGSSVGTPFYVSCADIFLQLLSEKWSRIFSHVLASSSPQMLVPGGSPAAGEWQLHANLSRF